MAAESSPAKTWITRSTSPGFSVFGEMQVISVLEMRVAGTVVSPNLHVMLPESVKFEPAIFTLVPPLVGPWFGSASNKNGGL